MNETIDVIIPVDPAAAAALGDSHNREAIGRLVSRVLAPRAGPSPLAEAIAALKAEARAARLVSGDEDLLILHPWREIDILRPAAYLARILC